MTAAEQQAIQLLSTSLQNYIEENRHQHGEIKTTLFTIKDELKQDFSERLLTLNDSIEHIQAHCKDRELEVSRLLNERNAMVDKRLKEREAEVDKLAKEAGPSVYRLATQGLGRFAMRLLIVLAPLVSIAILVLDRLHKF